jgi:enamine deaminase RidA (YjgF/YER057c/UK114 family)
VSAHIEHVEVAKTDFFMPFSPVLRVPAGGDLLFLSGTTALPLFHQHPHIHEDLNPPEDVQEQTRLLMENMRACLEAAGAGFSDVVRTDVFITDMGDQDAIGEVLGQYFSEPYPASTLIQIGSLVDPRVKLEISAIAVVPSSRND